MGHRIETRWFRTREEAEADQALPGQPGYSERYPYGIREGRNTQGEPVFGSTVEEYYG